MNWELCPSLVVLRAEINALYPGRDKRTDGTISGYPGSISSHNINSHGFVCALDVTVGDYPNGITPAQGQDLAERLRIASRDQPRGITVYGIHYMEPPYVAVAGPKICSAPDYEWRHYAGPLHKDHVHWSADWDVFMGEAPSGLADYTTLSPWLGELSMEDEMAVLSAITGEAMRNLQGMVLSTVRTALAPFLQRLTDIQSSVAFQEKYAVKMFTEIASKLGVTITEEDLEAVKEAVREEIAAGIKIEGTLTAVSIEKEDPAS